MINLSINSACNNNCDYCFQKDSYHQLDKELSLKEVVDFLDNWCVGAARIGILGGEPTLHPQCVEICEESSKRYRTTIFSNFLCDVEIIEKLMNLSNINWLINTTTREELMPIFNRNIEFASTFKKIPIMTFGVTLTGDYDVDIKYIDNLIRIGKKYGNLVNNYRISLATPCHDKEYKLINYDASVIKLYTESQIHTPHYKIAFDCTVNSCQLSYKLIADILADPKTMFISSSCNCAAMSIMVDKTVDQCFSAPEELFNNKKYTDFKNWRECYKYILQTRNSFMQKYAYFCRTCNKCNNENCHGACFASLAHLVKQAQSKPRLIRELEKIKYRIINRDKY